MNNFWIQNIRTRILYGSIWVVLTSIQILLLRFYISSELFWNYCHFLLIYNTIQAIGILGLGYPVYYYRNIVSIPLFLLFHLLLWILWMSIAWLLGCWISDNLFLNLLPISILIGLLLYVAFMLTYYINFSRNAFEMPKETEQETAETAVSIEKITRISVKKHQEIRFLPVEQIYCIEANGDYVLIHTSDSKYLKDKTMKYWETHLPDDLFVRIHRSFIVNIEMIAKIELYEKESYKVQLKNGVQIKASAAGYKLLRLRM